MMTCALPQPSEHLNLFRLLNAALARGALPASSRICAKALSLPRLPSVQKKAICGRFNACSMIWGKNDRCDDGAGPGLQSVAEQSPPPSGLLQAVLRRGRKRSDASEKAQWRLRHALSHEVSDGLSLLRPHS